MITRCHRCEQDRCTECTPTLLCNGCLGVDPQVKTCLDCSQPFCLFCQDDFGACKECLGAICPDCFSLSNKSERAGACRPCHSPPEPLPPTSYPLPPTFTVHDDAPYNEAELKQKTVLWRPEWKRRGWVGYHNAVRLREEAKRKPK